MDSRESWKKRLDRRTSLWMRTINRDCWCDKNRFLTLGISVVLRSRTVSGLAVLSFSLVRHWPLWLFWHCLGKKNFVSEPRGSDQRPAKKRRIDQQGCGWWNSVIAKQPKLEEERRRREIVWLGNLLYAAAHFFADVFNAQRWRLSERAKCFLSYIMCCVWGCSRYGNHSHGDFFFSFEAFTEWSIGTTR